MATVCCENDLHDEAYKKFCLLDEKMPYDGRMLYFKAVAAYKSGRIHEAERTLERTDSNATSNYAYDALLKESGEKEGAFAAGEAAFRGNSVSALALSADNDVFF